jgi:hypothetical protein
MIFQLGFVLILKYSKNWKALFCKGFEDMWPLNYYFFNEWHLRTCLREFRNVHVVFGIAICHYLHSNLFLWKNVALGFVVVVVWLKLPETALDVKQTETKRWKIERWMIHSVLVFSFVMTIAVIFTSYLIILK